MPQLKSEPPYAPAAADSDGWLQIVGVVADARDDGLREPVKPAIYVPYTMKMPMFTQILVRTRGEPLSVLRAVRAQVHAVDPDQQVMGNVRNLEQWISTQPEWAQERLVATLFGAFAVLAMLLSVFGLYSVVSYIVAQRTNEFGIRMALGAGRTHVLRLVFASTALSVGGGMLIGVVLSLALKGVLSRWAEGSSMDACIVLVVAAAAGRGCDRRLHAARVPGFRDRSGHRLALRVNATWRTLQRAAANFSSPSRAGLSARHGLRSDYYAGLVRPMIQQLLGFRIFDLRVLQFDLASSLNLPSFTSNAAQHEVGDERIAVQGHRLACHGLRLRDTGSGR